MATLQDYLGITSLRDAWPKWKANVIAINNQVIAHVAGTADKHSAQDITYTGDFVGKTEVKAALDQAKTEIDTIVVNASIDPEVAFARDSAVKGETFDTLDARLEESEQDLVSYKAETTKHLTNWLNVRESPYNANADGITSDSAIFKQVVDDLGLLGGGLLFAPLGEYFFADYVLVPDNITIIGEGRGLTIFKSKLQTNGSQKIFKNADQVNGNKNIKIIDVTLDGNRGTYEGKASTAVEEQNRMIDFKNCTDVVLDFEIRNAVTDWYTGVEGNTHPVNVLVLDSRNITFDISVENCGQEGVQLGRCTDVHGKKFVAKNNPIIWTPLNIGTDTLASDSKDIVIDYIKIEGSDGSALNINGENIHLKTLILYDAGHSFLDIGPEGMATGEFSKNVKIDSLTCYDNIGTGITGAQRSCLSFSGTGLQVGKMYGEGMEIGLSCGNANSIQVDSIIMKYLKQRRTDGGLLSNGVCLRDCSNVEISKIDIYDSENYGVRILSSQNITIGLLIASKSPQLFKMEDVDSLVINTLLLDNSEIALTSTSLFIDSTVLPSNNISIPVAKLKGTTGYGLSLTNTTNVSIGDATGLDKIIYTTSYDSSMVAHSGRDVYNCRNPIQFGTTYLWFDSSFSLRSKQTHPTSDKDGKIEKSTEVSTLLTGGRPTSPVKGERVYDNTLLIPIWHDGANWKDALGTVV